MLVILQERVANLGNVGDQVKVKAGYARNYLLPRDKAVQATKANLEKFEIRRVELEKRAAEVLANAKQRAEALADFKVTLSVLSSEEGKLFGSVGPRDIATAAVEAGQQIEKSEIEMPNGPIRNLGEYDVTVHLHTEVSATIKVILTPIAQNA
jgi:large subunit ribosomal protein L9